MGSMSYCQFDNLDSALDDCIESIEDGDKLSEQEAIAALRVRAKCERLLELLRHATVDSLKRG